MISPDTDHLVPSLSVDALLSRRDAAREALARIAQAVADYQKLGESVGAGYESADLVSRAPHKWSEPLNAGSRYSDERLTSPGWLEWAQKNVDSALWEHLLALSGIRTYMDAEAKRDWDETIEQNKTPELTAPNIRETFLALHGKRQDFFERGVVKLFRSLSWDYKSNRPQKFGTRIVVRHLRGTGYFTLPEHERCRVLDDLIRAHCILDGKPEPDHRQGAYHHLSAIKEYGIDWVSDYLRVRTFKNGNGHLFFRRPDLVEQLNRILHKHHPDALAAENG